jgi:hypothetical protein
MRRDVRVLKGVSSGFEGRFASIMMKLLAFVAPSLRRRDHSGFEGRFLLHDSYYKRYCASP